MPAKKPTRVKKSVRGKRPKGLTSAIGPKATTIVVICVMAGGIAIAARQQSRPKSAPTVDAADERPDFAPSPAAAPRAGSTRAATSNGSDAGSAPTAPVPVATALKATPVTVTGCLERTEDTFRLKDTAGADVPKSRSWKSGFLKKGSAPIALVDATHSLRLADQVGRRVSVTGTLVDREMRVRSLHRVAPSCLERPGA
jgi:hypothetical protein